MTDRYEDIDLKTVLEQSFATGKGVVCLSASMTDEQILALIKQACGWSQGKAFHVIPPTVTITQAQETGIGHPIGSDPI